MRLRASTLVLLLGEEESVSPDLAAESWRRWTDPSSAAAYRIAQDTGRSARSCACRAPVRLARRDGATIHAKAGVLELRPPAGPTPPPPRLVASAPVARGGDDDLDADSDALAAVLYACGAQPRLRHLARRPARRARTDRASRRGTRWPRCALAAFSSYRMAVAYAKLWEMRRAVRVSGGDAARVLHAAPRRPRPGGDPPRPRVRAGVVAPRSSVALPPDADRFPRARPAYRVAGGWAGRDRAHLPAWRCARAARPRDVHRSRRGLCGSSR